MNVTISWAGHAPPLSLSTTGIYILNSLWERFILINSIQAIMLLMPAHSHISEYTSSLVINLYLDKPLRIRKSWEYLLPDIEVWLNSLKLHTPSWASPQWPRWTFDMLKSNWKLNIALRWKNYINMDNSNYMTLINFKLLDSFNLGLDFAVFIPTNEDKVKNIFYHLFLSLLED